MADDAPRQEEAEEEAPDPEKVVIRLMVSLEPGPRRLPEEGILRMHISKQAQCFGFDSGEGFGSCQGRVQELPLQGI